jgi:hypothetical protein
MTAQQSSSPREPKGPGGVDGLGGLDGSSGADASEESDRPARANKSVTPKPPTVGTALRPTTRSGRTVVTHPRTVATRVARSPLALPDIEASSGLSELALRSLMRAQLRMGLRYLAVIVGSLVAVPLVLANAKWLAERSLLGVPLPWLFVGVGFFPLLLGVAVSYTRSIARLELAYLNVLERP